MTDQAKGQSAQTPESARKVLQQTSVWARWQFSLGKGRKKKKSDPQVEHITEDVLTAPSPKFSVYTL